MVPYSGLFYNSSRLQLRQVSQMSKQLHLYKHIIINLKKKTSNLHDKSPT